MEPDQFRFIEIIITDFVDDPIDEGAFAVNFQINGPGDNVEYLRVSFSDDFFERYFHVAWQQDLAKEERKVIREQRSLLVKWAVCRIEKWLLEKRPPGNIMIQPGKDIEWAKGVAFGKIPQISQPQEPNKYIFAIRK